MRAVIGLAHGLGLVATAEGVEDEETLAILAEMGCDNVQGFLIAKPLEGCELVPWMLESEALSHVVPISAAVARRQA